MTALISEAGTDPKVVGLVYVAAFAPDAGQVVGELGKAQKVAQLIIDAAKSGAPRD